MARATACALKRHIARCVTTALLALLTALVGVACSRVERSGSSGRHSWTEPGILRIASVSDPDTLSPLVGNFQIDFDLAMFWGGFLFNYSDKNELVPELALREPTLANHGIAPDGRTITYHLRKGVRWQDGPPFTAADVIFTWHAIMNPRNNVGDRSAYERITRIDAPDPFTIVVHLDRPYAPFVATFLTQGSIPIPVYPKHLLAQYPDLNRIAYNTAPVGTGPFKVLVWHRGGTIRMVANSTYWRGPPKLKEVDYRAIPDEQTIVTLLKTHEIDLWYNADSALYPLVKNISGTHVDLTPFTWYDQIGFNTVRPALHDVRVRQALAYATNRKAIVDATSFGVNTLGEGDQPDVSWAHNPNVRSYPYEPARANALFDAAGWHRAADGIRTRNGKRLTLEVATLAGETIGQRTAVLLQSQWRAVGVELIVKTYASGLMFATYGAGGIIQGGKMDLAYSGWLNGVDPDDSMIVTCAAIPPAGQNYYRYCNPTVDRLEQTALTHDERAVRRRAYERVQRIIVDEVPFLTLSFNRQMSVVSNDLHNYRPAHAVTAFWNTWDYTI